MHYKIVRIGSVPSDRQNSDLFFLIIVLINSQNIPLGLDATNVLSKSKLNFIGALILNRTFISYYLFELIIFKSRWDLGSK